VFGPVASVIRARLRACAGAANHTEFGLSSCICTTSLKRAPHLKRRAQVGMAMVNLPTAGVDDHVPFASDNALFGPSQADAKPMIETPVSGASLCRRAAGMQRSGQ